MGMQQILLQLRQVESVQTEAGAHAAPLDTAHLHMQWHKLSVLASQAEYSPSPTQ